MRRGLENVVPGLRVDEATADPHPRFTSGGDVQGATFTDVRRRGKYLLLGLDDGRELVVHLGMTGVLVYHRAGEASPPTKHVRCEWVLSDGSRLVLSDPRKFGKVAVVRGGEHGELGLLGTLGAEPLEAGFTAEALKEGLDRSRATLKSQLLAQKVVAGAGNIYVDEALWLARIHPEQRSVTLEEAERLRDALVHVLGASVERKGTTLKDYRTSSGDSGENQHHLQCYGRGGEPCPTCGETLQTKRVAGRGTTYCPACQPEPQAEAEGP